MADTNETTNEPAPELTVEAVGRAMQQAWDDFCDDAGAHPEAFFREGRKLYADFGRGNFTRMVAMNLGAKDA